MIHIAGECPHNLIPSTSIITNSQFLGELKTRSSSNQTWRILENPLMWMFRTPRLIIGRFLGDIPWRFKE
jgi:hypothetical protein